MPEGMTEFDLIGRLRAARTASAGRFRRLVHGIGDDAAITVPGGATATSVDSVVDGVHFDSGTAGPEQIAAKAIASALSDLAAMAAEPGEVYVSLGVPEGASPEWLERLADATGAEADRHGAALAGGDIVASPVLMMSVTVVGHRSRADDFVTRAGARPGQALALTGPVGGAVAGLRLLTDAGLAEELPGPLARALVARQLEPEPRLEAGLALGRGGASAMIDISDGLGADAAHLAAESRVAIEIEAANVPLAEGVEQVAGLLGADPYELAFSGGEDYELLACLPADRLGRAAASGAPGVVAIGTVAEGEGVRIVSPDGARIEAGGHDHLS